MLISHSSRPPASHRFSPQANAWLIVLVLSVATLAVLLVAPPHAEGIDGGTFPTDDAVSRATVRVDGGCSGTLVAADLVLSAGHCFGAHGPVPRPAPHRPFRDGRRLWNDWQRPDRWYPTSVLIRIGVNPRNIKYTGRARQYAIPGNADMVLLRLVEPVPPDVAVPVPVMTRLPSPYGPTGDSWISGRNFVAAGFGTNAAGRVDGRLREARVRGDIYPCPRGRDGWAFGGDHKLCVRRIDGIVRPGDSGGPLYWTGRDGSRQLVAVTQGIEGSRAARLTATFYRGGANFLNTGTQPLANIGSWLERHIDGDVGSVAFLMSGSSRDHYPSSTFTTNPGGLDPRVTPVENGVYRAQFPGLRASLPSLSRTLSVTAVAGDGRYCKLDEADDEDVLIRCFASDGTPTRSSFSLLSMDPAIGDSAIVSLGEAGVPMVTSRAPFSVTRVGVGRYRVSRSTPPREAWKYAAVTAEGSGPERCNVTTWGPRDVFVRCSEPDGSLADSGFHLLATGSADESYAWSPNAVRRSGPALRDSSQVAGSTASPRITREDRGRYRVGFPGLPAVRAGNVQVSVHGPTSDHCAVASWNADSVLVRCSDVDGRPVDARFTVRYVDPLDDGAFVQVRLLSVRGLSLDRCGRQLDLAGAIRFDSSLRTSPAPLAFIAGFARREDRNVRRLDREGAVPTIAGFSRPGARYVDVVAAVTDEGIARCGGRRTADLVPGPTVRDLRLRIDLHRYRAVVLDPRESIQSGLGRIAVSGRQGPAQARIELSVDVIRPSRRS